MRRSHQVRVGIGILIGIGTACLTVAAQDWPQWRGPNRDGALTSFAKPTAWPERLRQQWQIDVGLGYATPLLVGDRVYTFTRQADDEVLQALDASSGKVVWRTSYPAPFQMLAATARHGAGPKSTPTYADGRIFTLGMSGIFTAFDAKTGKQLWQKPGPAAQPMFHTAMSPVVDRGLVIIHIGGPGDTALTAFDVATGAARWTWKDDSPAYGSPIVVELGGTRQVITFTNQNLVGVSMANGQLLWRRPFTTPSNTTATTPILYRDMVIQTGRENGVTAFRVIPQPGEWKTENVWQTKEVSVHMSNAIAMDGVLFGLSHLNSGQYFALDLNSGKVLWTSMPRQAENAAMVRAGDIIFSLENDGELVVMDASRTAFNVQRRWEAATAETWAQPAISGNRAFVKDVSKLTLWMLN